MIARPMAQMLVRATAPLDDITFVLQTNSRAVNESVVRVAIIDGEYHWHKHDEDDEFFYVVEGKLVIDLRIELKDSTVELAPRQGFVVPRGVVHRTRAPQRTVILMVENAGIIPTGN